MSLHKDWTEKHKTAILISFVLLGIVGMWATNKQSAKSVTETAVANARLAESLNRLDETTKETNRVTNLNTKLQERLLASNSDIASLAKKSIDTTTGGDSYCWMMIKGKYVSFFNGGKYPLYDVNARIVDLRVFDKIVKEKKDLAMDDFQPAEFNVQVGDIIVSAAAVKDNLIPLSKLQNSDINVFFSARNGFWTQVIRRRMVDGRWLTATKVTRSILDGKTNKDITKVLFERVESNFPRNKDRNVEW